MGDESSTKPPARLRSPMPIAASPRIMEGIPRPPPVSFSAPESRVQTPPPPNHKRRNAFSKPSSPIGAKKRSSIGSKVMPPPAPALSPARALRRHRYHATFEKHNPRTADLDAPCPVHAYSSAAQEIAMLPSHSVGGVKFGDTPRGAERPAPCPVHAYSSAAQEIAVLPSHSVGGVKFGDTPRLLTAVRPNCPVHVYAEAKSTLSAIGGAPFGTSRLGRDVYQLAGFAPVHAYASPASTLRQVGAIRWARPSKQLPRTLPKLAPLGEANRPLDSAVVKEDGDDSPREVEAPLVV